MNKFQRISRDQRGFNLIELMIVIAIIGLLIGVGSIASVSYTHLTLPTILRV